MLLTPEDVESRKRHLASGDLAALTGSIRAEVARVLSRPVHLPAEKALLSRWGQLCRDDEAELGFDPFSPYSQRCTRCGRIWETEQSRRWWVYWYQQWLAERTWLCALASVLDHNREAADRAREVLAAVASRYESWPCADNVLGPSRPFFSTYLESIWVLQLAAAAELLRARGELPRELERDLTQRLFRPSAETIADFDEGRSNRQVWNSTALLALGTWLRDEAMVRGAVEGSSGLVRLVERGLLADGLWFEGENYHWFALRGLAWAAELLRSSGLADWWSDTGQTGRQFREAFRAPALTALPDFTFPARRDSRFGVSLRQRRMAELWELARARIGEPWLDPLLATVYDPAIPARDDRWLECTEIERDAPPSGVRRELLGWKAWLWMSPERPATDGKWVGTDVLLPATGLAIIRGDGGSTYVSLDYGEPGGGHGHPDRLNLTVVARGEPWLLDFGTGSYVSRTLSWYRSTLAHNAPLLDGQPQHPARGQLVAFDRQDGAAWVCALLPENTAFEGATIQRTVVVTEGYILDVMQMASSVGERELMLPWHGLGTAVADQHGVVFTRSSGAKLPVRLTARQPFRILMQRAPGPPDGKEEHAELEFPIVISSGEEVTLVACLDLGAGVEDLECVEDDFVVRMRGGIHLHRATDTGWEVERDRGDPFVLGGLVPDEPSAPGEGEERSERDAASSLGVGRGGFGAIVVPGVATVTEKRPVAARCLKVPVQPALDGSLAGFGTDAPLLLDRLDQFRRAEAPWPGAGAFSSRAWLNHDRSQLYVAVEVTQPSLNFRPPDSPDPEWENENPDIHSDGIQLYIETAGFFGWLVVPDTGRRDRLRVSAVGASDAFAEMVTGGAWTPTPGGYRITLALDVPELLDHASFGFDLYVNRLDDGRARRSGQLVWSGARGSRLYLAGDRALPGRLPLVEVEQ
ncbi:MAG TPA: heparinase II/III family protein [Gemmatimonadales bacterium]|nr:heparinase II/III family protein [Gemmatimonadales bacterium]